MPRRSPPRPPRARHVLSTVLLLAAVGPSGSDAAGQSRYQVVQQGNHLWYYRSSLDETLQPYYVYIPRDFDPSEAHPLVTFLHGFGGRAGTAAPDVWRQNWADGGGWLLACADGRGSQNWDFIGEDDLYYLIEDLQKTTPYHPALRLDTRRLYLEGGSMGGHGGYREGFRYPDRFAAVVPAAGWTTYREFYDHWYDRTDSPRLPDYVDPARQPVLETASSLWQAPNARRVWVYLVYDTNDSVNPPVNQEEVTRKLQALGSDRFASRVGELGHVGSYSAKASYHFFSTKTLEAKPPDVVYTTNDLRYNRSYWVAVDRLYLTRQWGSVDARVVRSSGLQRIQVRTSNVLAFSLDLSRAPVDVHKPVYISIDGEGADPVADQPSLSFRAWLNQDHEVTSWSRSGPVGAPPEARRETKSGKRPGLAGPVADAFRTPFALVYGTRHRALGGSTDNPDWVAAQHFATEWNAWMTLHWQGGAAPPPERRDDWWILPYPFANGPLVPERQPLVMPLPDHTYDLKTLPLDRNLILFGDPSANWIVERVARGLPLELTPPEATPGIRVGSRLYSGEHVNYFFVAPNPLNPERYVVVARGYLSSRVDPSRYGAGNVGKDLEALPFYWPDYVVWDARLSPSPAKQKPFVYLPAAFLDAGYFGEDWRLDTTPPRTKIKVERVEPSDGYPDGGAKVTLSARDAAGGFGVEGIEYRLDSGPWRVYGQPFVVCGGPVRSLSVRATDKCGQFVYHHSVSPDVGVPAHGNVEPPQTLELRLGEEDAPQAAAGSSPPR